MNDTPETIAVWRKTLADKGSWHVEPFAHACKLERERDEAQQALRKCQNEYIESCHDRMAQLETIKLECNKLRHKLEICMAANSDVKRIAMERNALAHALRVRIGGWNCEECGHCIDYINGHAETCRHYETEKKVTEKG